MTPATALLALWLLQVPPSAAGPVPGSARGPKVLVRVPAVHVRADEALGPELLAALARPEVVLWLSTRGNTVAPAVAEALERGAQVLVRVRAPLKAVSLAVLAPAPRAGLWCSAEDAASVAQRAGPRPLGISVTGASLAGLVDTHPRPSHVRVEGQEPTLEGLALVSQLEGERTWVTGLGDGALGDLCAVPTLPGKVRFEVAAPRTKAEWQAVAGCAQPLRLRVDPATDQRALLEALRSRAGLELMLEVGADPVRARWAVGLLRSLEPAADAGPAGPGGSPGTHVPEQAR